MVETNNLALVLELLLDERAKTKALSGMKDMEKGLESIGMTAEKVDKKQAEISDKSAQRTKKEMADEAAFMAQRAKDDKAMLDEVNARNVRLAALAKAAANQPVQPKKPFVSPDPARQTFSGTRADPLGKDYLSTQKATTQAAEASADALRQEKEEAEAVNREISKMAYLADKTEQEIEQLPESAYQFGQEMVKANEKLIRLRQDQRRSARAEQSLMQAGTALSIGGMAVVGGAFAMAQAEANRQKSSGQPIDATTTKWLEANKRIELSTRRIAQTAERIILPYLEKASALAERASKYIESKPEMVKAILAAGATAAVIGGALVLLSKGVRLVADVKYILANAQFDLATIRFEKSVAGFLLSSGKYGVSGGLIGPPVAGASAAGGGLIAVLGTLASVLGGIVAGGAIYDKFIKKPEQDSSLTILGKTLTMAGAGLVSMFESVGLASKGATATTFQYLASLTGVDGKAKKAADALDDLSASTEALAETAKKNAEGWKVVRDLEQANNTAEIQFRNDRASILADANKSMADANQQYKNTADKIRGNIKKIATDLAANESKITSDFKTSNIEAERQYQSERSKIIQQGGEDIRKIEEDSQEQLRQLAEDYARQVVDLTAARDAGGLVLAGREYNRQKKEITQSTSKEVAEKRRDLAMQLQDLRAANVQQRAERYAQYVQAINDARAQAAQQKAEQEAQLAEAARVRRLELADIARTRAEALRILVSSFNEERRQRLQSAYNSIRDIGGALEVERAFKLKYYAAMLTDVQTFITQYAAKMKLSPSTSTTGTPKFAAGGYTSGGLISSHPNEFILSPATTRAAENLIGGRLTQASMIRGLSGGGASIQLNDNRRFDSRIPQSERNAIREEAIEDTRILISEMLKS
jgi:hypothetical protein